MATQELHHLIVKLEGFQKQLGGPLDAGSKKDIDEFNRIKMALAENANYISKKQDERDAMVSKTGRNMGVIKAGCDIREKIDDSYKQLEQMKDALRRQRKNLKKYPANQVEIKEKQMQNCKKLIDQLHNREEGGMVTEPDEKIITLTEMKIQLTAKNNTTGSYIDRDLNQEETDALKAFKQKDKELDAIILQINDGLDVLKTKAEMMGEKIEQQDTMIADLGQEVSKTVTQLETANARLKKVLYQFRSPGRFCMQIVCMLILLGLIGVIIKLSTMGTF